LSLLGNLGLFVRRVLHVLARPVPKRKGVAVHPYKGYGTREKVVVLGRALRQPVPSGTDQGRKLGRDLLGLLRRMTRWGVGQAEIEVAVGEIRTRLTADGDGYFKEVIDLPQPLPPGLSGVDAMFRTHEGPARESGTSESQAREVRPGGGQGREVDLGEGPEDPNPVIDASGSGKQAAESVGRIHIAPSDSRFMVISDIDDTVVHTGVARKAAMLWNTFMEGADSRVAFPGVAAFYRALHRGPSGEEENPLFYVSRGPWSIYEVIRAFLAVHRFPEGPVLLRDWGMTLKHPLPRRGKGHKERIIREILDHFAPAPFVLIGDSGQGDPEIYADVVHEYPGRILAVYIRNVTRTRDRAGSIAKLAREVEEAGSDLLLADNSLVMARHAAESGLISQGALPEISEEISSEARSGE